MYVCMYVTVWFLLIIRRSYGDLTTLLHKLEAYNVDKNALPWFKSYLTDRSHWFH